VRADVADVGLVCGDERLAKGRGWWRGGGWRDLWSGVASRSGRTGGQRLPALGQRAARPAGPRTGPTKAGDAGLRQQLYLAAKRARLIDPTLAAKYHRLVVEQGKHHVSAICNLAPILLTRVAACWRNGQRYVLRDIDGREITPAEGRQICADRYSIPDEVRRRRRRTTKTKQHKGRTGQRDQESTSAAPASDPSHPETYRRTA